MYWTEYYRGRPAHKVRITTREGDVKIAFRKPKNSRDEAFYCRLGRELNIEIPPMLLDKNGYGYSIALPRSFGHPPDFFYAKSPYANMIRKWRFSKILQTCKPYDIGRMVCFLMWINQNDPHNENFMMRKVGTRTEIIPIDFEGGIVKPFDRDILEDMCAFFRFCQNAFKNSGREAEFHAGVAQMLDCIEKLADYFPGKTMEIKDIEAGKLYALYLNGLRNPSPLDRSHAYSIADALHRRIPVIRDHQKHIDNSLPTGWRPFLGNPSKNVAPQITL